MRYVAWTFLMLNIIQAKPVINISNVRRLYQLAPVLRQEAMQLDQVMLNVNSDTKIPVLVCYQGANEMIQAKYTWNPYKKFERFNKGKMLIEKALNLDTLSLEMRFIRYSIQSNLPAFLGYHDRLDSDKQFLLDNVRKSKDPELKLMVTEYLSVIKNTKNKKDKN